MLTDDLDLLQEIVDDLEDRDDVNVVLLDDLKESGIGCAATARLEVSFGGPDHDADDFDVGSTRARRHQHAGPRSTGEFVSTGNGEFASAEASERDIDTSESVAIGAEDLIEGGPADENADDSDDSRDSQESEESDESADEFWCGRCGHGPLTENGVKIHNGHQHDGRPVVLDHEPDEDELESTDDSDEEDESEDEGGDEETESDENSDDDRYVCESCGTSHVSKDAVEGCCASDEPDRDEDDEYEVGDPVPDEAEDATEQASSDGGQVVLPAGLTEDDVRQAASRYQYLGDVTDSLAEKTDADLTHQKVRTYLVALDLYSGVDDVVRRRGGAS